MALDRTSLTEKRRAFTQAHTIRERAQADLASATTTVDALSRTAAADDPQLLAARADAAREQQAVTEARTAENTALADVQAALAGWLGEDPAADVGRLESNPIVLLPVRVETRFVAESSELRVRIYPDEILADGHEPELSAAERAAGVAYWSTGKDDLAAWQRLLQTYPSPRAAWIVRVTEPSPQAAVQSIDKPPGWSQAVQARLLPDRFVVIATRGSTTTRRGVGAPVLEPLALTVGPDSLASDQVQLGPDATFTLDEAVTWTIDFDKAVSVGMGIRLPVDADDLRLGFDRLLVIGVKTSMDAPSSAQSLGALFDAHHYTRGMAFIPQGSPTSNTLGTPAAYPPSDDNGAHSFAIERGAPLDTHSGCAAQTLTRALGLGGGHFAHVEGADLSEVIPALKMNRALYSATLGYYLDQMMAPLVSTEAVNEIGQYFSQWVIPRGLASAFRVGRVPYGVLPATSLSRWQHADTDTAVHRRMVELLQKIRPFWLAAASAAPHVGRSTDPDQDLLDVLAMDASAREARVRQVVGDGTWLNLAQLFGWPIKQWEDYHKTVGADLLDAAGISAPTPPRVLGMNFSDKSWLYHGPLVDIVALSETDPLGPRDYISWVRTATVEQLHLELLPTGMNPDIKRALLYRFLRHGALAEYHWWAGILLARFTPPVLTAVADAPDTSATPSDAGRWREPELVGIVSGTENRQTPWQRFDNQVDLDGLIIAIAALLDGDFESQLRALTGVGDYRDALTVLAPLPTAELERLFTETLDAASHRLDAWITSLATQRLVQPRRGGDIASGCFIGAYGWVENVIPETGRTVTLPNGRVVRTTPGGYIQAPSKTRADTAAAPHHVFVRLRPLLPSPLCPRFRPPVPLVLLAVPLLWRSRVPAQLAFFRDALSL